MDLLLHSLLTFVLLYRYAAVFLIVFLGAVGVPMPSGAVLATSFFFTTQGFLSVWPVAVAGLAANIAGDLAIYWLARFQGKRIFRGIGLGRLVESAAMRRFETKLDEHPVSTVFLSRFVTTVTPLVNFMAGLAKMPFRTFIIVDVIGQVGEVFVNFVLGTFFGDSWTYLTSLFGKIGFLVAALTVALMIFLWRRWSRRGRTHRLAHQADLTGSNEGAADSDRQPTRHGI